MRANEHDLNSLRGMIRRLQEENASLKKLLEENNILYASSEMLDVTEVPDEYDEDQGARIIPLNPDTDMAKEFYSYFWGRTDVYARRGKAGGYFPRCSAWWNTRLVLKKLTKRGFVMRTALISYGKNSLRRLFYVTSRDIRRIVRML